MNWTLQLPAGTLVAVKVFLPAGMNCFVLFPVLGGQVMSNLMFWYLFCPLVHLQITEVDCFLQETFLIPLNLSTEVVIDWRAEAGAFCPVLDLAVIWTW